MAARLTTQQKAWRMQREADVERVVYDGLNLYGFRWQHQRPGVNARGRYMTAISGMPGAPDIVAVKGSVLLYAELKRELGQLEPEQVAWRDALVKAGVEWWMVKPSNVERFIKRLQEVK